MKLSVNVNALTGASGVGKQTRNLRCGAISPDDRRFWNNSWDSRAALPYPRDGNRMSCDRTPRRSRNFFRRMYPVSTSSESNTGIDSNILDCQLIQCDLG